MGINSKYNHITNHTQLMHTIMHVNASRVQQEQDLKYKLKELYYSFQPATLLKKAFSKKNHDSEIPKGIAQSALAMGTNFLIGKVFKRGASVKGYLLSLAMEKAADYALSGKSTWITKGIGKLGNLIKKFKS